MFPTVIRLQATFAEGGELIVLTAGYMTSNQSGKANHLITFTKPYIPSLKWGSTPQITR
jgi:hypothetical protein